MEQEVTSLRFEDMILARTKAWAESYDEQTRPFLDDAVTMTMRKRGDNFGYLYKSSYSSQWRPFTGKGMVSYPVVSRAVKSKTATSVATTIGIKIESFRKSPEKEAGAEMCQSIYKFHQPLMWNKDHEATIAELCQLARYCFKINLFNKQGGMLVDVPLTEERMLKQGFTDYVCAGCGFEFSPEDLGIEDVADAQHAEAEDLETDEPLQLEAGDEMPEDVETDEVLDGEYVGDMQDDEPETALAETEYQPCPNCGGDLQLQNVAAYEKSNVLTGDFAQVDTGMPDTFIVSPLLTRIDSYKCIGFKPKNAGWFNYHPLLSAYEVVQMIPELADKINKGDFTRWSESAQWHYRLSNGSSDDGREHHDYELDELMEVNFWWLAPKSCHGWVSPDRYDKLGITIEIGETIEDAFVRQFGSFEGACVFVYDEEVYILANEFFSSYWNGVPWRIDAQSFFPQGEEGLLKLQDAAINILSMIYSFVQRMSNPKLIVDGMRFDQQAVANNQTGQIVWMKQALNEGVNADWKNHIGYLQPTDLSQAVYKLIELIIMIAKEESGVFDEMVGNTQGQETLGGREMSLNQGLGLMTPTQQAKGVAMIEDVYQWLENWQRDAPDEAYQLLKGTFEEEWKPQDIEAFKNLNIRKEIFVAVVSGTDVPKTQTEMEMRFMTAVNMRLFDENNPIPIEIRAHIIKEVLGIDYDLKNYYASRRLAARRFAALRDELSGYEPQDAFTIAPDLNGIPVRSLRPEIIASIAQDPRTMSRQTDDALTFIAYYTDQLNGLVGAKEPNEVLIAALEKQIDAHRAVLAASLAQASAAEGTATTPPNAIAPPAAGQPQVTA